MAPLPDLLRFDAVLFDLDGVLTPTADVHTRAWKATFDEFLRRQGSTDTFSPDDYLAHVDGKPRYDGVRDYLASRGVHLPDGDDADVGWETIRGVGNRKDRLVNDLLRTEGVDPYPGSLALLERLADRDIPRAVVSSSRNAGRVLAASGLDQFFDDDTRVDGEVAGALGLPGKPAPDTFVEAARRLDVKVESTVVVEDARSGVQAGAAGGFGLVVGVDRGAGRDAPGAGGAHVVVDDLADLLPALGSGITGR